MLWISDLYSWLDVFPQLARSPRLCDKNSTQEFLLATLFPEKAVDILDEPTLLSLRGLAFPEDWGIFFHAGDVLDTIPAHIVICGRSAWLLNIILIHSRICPLFLVLFQPNQSDDCQSMYDEAK
ncbi:hypothetical protein DID88_007468 [Monilinia fructigena]|uniref:Uncharacterized protein n=1 Tax=Monilinia fructigena TaxID=38457 RepID=A0A395J962_9HELO|nr:hypothetical protein DID88_007468 [Monilinia fructigena]